MRVSAAPLDNQRAFMEWLVSRTGTQAELARRSSLGTDVISDYVRGENEPKLGNILKMLRAAEVVIEGAPEREDLAEEAVRVLRRLEAELLDARSPAQASRVDV